MAEDCNEYPYALAVYRSPRTVLTLDLLGPDTTYRSLFTDPLKDVLQSCRNRVTAALERANACLSGSLPGEAELYSAIDGLSGTLTGSLTMQELMESPSDTWPTGVRENTEALYTAGLYINFHFIPAAAKSHIVDYFSESGDAFLNHLGELSLKDYFTRPRSTYSQTELELLFKGRRLGVLICHESASVTSTKNSCWNGTSCQSTSQTSVCTGDTASSDPC